ncbi:MAG: hypothetical protein UZ17_ACD001002182 [Acidobacteria bacterium OLB17]|nr:MAG: hypothetical protein UZ17_ACD001002182 [Acidobacteria bacterium OLB17]MCZ2390791.1 hypothetical protein [Acidobacteriota bacterium]
MTSEPNTRNAADEFVAATIDALRNEKGVHIETAIAATARMAGTFLFRSFGFQLADAEPGSAVLSDRANEKGPMLIDIVGQKLTAANLVPGPGTLEMEPGEEHRPHLSFLESQQKLEPSYDAIRRRWGLSLEDGAKAAAEAVGSLIVQGSQVLDPGIAFNIAAFGFVEGSKTLPADI